VLALIAADVPSESGVGSDAARRSKGSPTPSDEVRARQGGHVPHGLAQGRERSERQSRRRKVAKNSMRVEITRDFHLGVYEVTQKPIPGLSSM